MMHLVFVYGTLRKGLCNHGLLCNAREMGEARTDKGYSLRVSGLPYLVEDPNGKGVNGELYMVDDETLADLDRLEGHPRHYRRIELPIVTEASSVKVFAYLYEHPVTNDEVFEDYKTCGNTY